MAEKKRKPRKAATKKTAKPMRSKAIDPNTVSPEEETFCQHYVIHQNAYQAFMHSFPKAQNWKRATVDSRASELLSKGKIQARLTVLRMKMQTLADEKFEITATWVLAEYAKIAKASITDVARWGTKTVLRNRKTGMKDEKGKPIYEQIPVEVDFVEFVPSDELTPEQVAAVAAPEVTTDKFGNTHLSLKMHDRMKALDKLAQFTGLSSGKVVIEHNIRGKVEHSHEVKAIEEAKDDKEALKMFEAFRTGANAYAMK